MSTAEWTDKDFGWITVESEPRLAVFHEGFVFADTGLSPLEVALARRILALTSDNDQLSKRCRDLWNDLQRLTSEWSK